MDVRYINPFLEGVLEVLATMAFMKPVPGKPYVKKGEDAKGDVTGIIGLTGDVKGSLALSFGESAICMIVSNMLGENYTAINKETQDAVGEITNMVSGVARKKLEGHGLIVHASIPTVICGHGHSFSHVLGGVSLIIPFRTESGDFVVDVCIELI